GRTAAEKALRADRRGPPRAQNQAWFLRLVERQGREELQRDRTARARRQADPAVCRRGEERARRWHRRRRRPSRRGCYLRYRLRALSRRPAALRGEFRLGVTLC